MCTNKSVRISRADDIRPHRDIKINENSQIGPFLAGKQGISRQKAPESELFQNGAIHLSTDRIHTVKPLEVDIPKGRLTVVTGVSGSGKTTLILESLIPALSAHIRGEKLPAHVKSVSAEGIDQVTLRLSVSTCAPPLRHTPMCTMSCVKFSPARRTQKKANTKPATSPTTPASCAAPPATVPAVSAWTCSFCPM